MRTRIAVGILCGLGILAGDVLCYLAGYRLAQVVEVEAFHRKALAVHKSAVEELKAKHRANLEYLRAHCACNHEFEMED